jgi:hypothetical protein
MLKKLTDKTIDEIKLSNKLLMTAVVIAIFAHATLFPKYYTNE